MLKDIIKIKVGYEKEEILKNVEILYSAIKERHYSGKNTVASNTYRDFLFAIEDEIERTYSKGIEQVLASLALVTNDFLTEGEEIWKRVAGAIEVWRTYVQNEMLIPEVNSFYDLMTMLDDKGLSAKFLGRSITQKYTKEEIDEAAKFIDYSRDLDFDYLAIVSFNSKYNVRNDDKQAYMTPQDKYLMVAMYVHQEETDKRMELIKETYELTSEFVLSPSTPIMTNSNNNRSQLSACFIDTMNDDLSDIYNTDRSAAMVSKYGGGFGVYIGNIRGLNTEIRGIAGAASGVVPWTKKLNDTSVFVDQLGQRGGAVAIYNDVFHSDIQRFLELKLNNGDDRLRAHDIFLGVCIPDLFMERVVAKEEWSLFDPYEVEKFMGYKLQDFYDEQDGAGSFREKYAECEAHPLLPRKTVSAIEIMIKIMKVSLEGGTPYMFYRDEVNRKNPNKHRGMIYCSNLCTEVLQTQSATEMIEEATEDGKIVFYFNRGDFVVCNLASINLAKVGKYRREGKDVLRRVARLAVRLLDNTIDINNLPLKAAEITNQLYRAIGVGTLGWDQMRVEEGYEWDGEEILQFTKDLYEELSYYVIEASSDLAAERGSYDYFAGSEWETGEYFTRRNLFDDSSLKMDWPALYEKVKQQGMRNAYTMAVAPNATTSTVVQSTAGIDPVFATNFVEEKTDFKIPTTAPGLNFKTKALYAPVAQVANQFSSIKQNAVRQRFVDQGISMNFYVPKDIDAAVLLNLHIEAWKAKLKTTYYVRSTSNKVEGCVWCDG